MFEHRGPETAPSTTAHKHDHNGVRPASQHTLGRESMSHPTLRRPGSVATDRPAADLRARRDSSQGSPPTSTDFGHVPVHRKSAAREPVGISAEIQSTASVTEHECANDCLTCDQGLCGPVRSCLFVVVASVVHQLNRRPRRCSNTPGSGTRSINSAC